MEIDDLETNEPARVSRTEFGTLLIVSTLMSTVAVGVIAVLGGSYGLLDFLPGLLLTGWVTNLIWSPLCYWVYRHIKRSGWREAWCLLSAYLLSVCYVEFGGLVWQLSIAGWTRTNVGGYLVYGWLYGLLFLPLVYPLLWLSFRAAWDSTRSAGRPRRSSDR